MEGKDVTRCPRIIIQDTPDLGDQDSQVRVSDERVRPESFVQFSFRQRAWTRVYERLQQLKRFRREVDRIRPVKELAGFIVQREWAK
jgi:hypothetical protein